MLKRAAEEGRADDTPEGIARRLEIYHNETAPLSEHYRASDRLVGIDGSGTVDEVWPRSTGRSTSSGGGMNSCRLRGEESRGTVRFPLAAHRGTARCAEEGPPA